MVLGNIPGTPDVDLSMAPVTTLVEFDISASWRDSHRKMSSGHTIIVQKRNGKQGPSSEYTTTEHSSDTDLIAPGDCQILSMVRGCYLWRHEIRRQVVLVRTAIVMRRATREQTGRLTRRSE